MFAPEPDPLPTRRYPSPIPQGPNRGPLEQPGPFPKRSAPVGMATSPLAGTRQTMGGGAQAALTDRLMTPAPAPPMVAGFGPKNSDFPPTHGGNDIPEPPVVSTDPTNPGGPVVGGGDPQRPPSASPYPPGYDPHMDLGPNGELGWTYHPANPSNSANDPNPAPPDASRWLHTGGAAPGSLSAIIQAKLEELLNQGPVDPNSEDIKNVVNAARVQERRQGDRARAAMMERRAATGLAGGGGTDTGILGIEQGIGERLGGLSAGMVREAQINRANQIMQALTLGQGRIDAEQQRALQSELANIQATLQREGMALQNSQFEAQMSMQALLAMLAGLGGGN